MRQRQMLAGAIVAGAILAGCGGDDGGSGAATPAPVGTSPAPADNTRVPAEAMASSAAFMTFLKAFVAGDSETEEPRELDASEAGANDGAEPDPV